VPDNNQIEQRRLPALADELGQEVRAAEEAWRDAVGHAIRAGELLTEAKQLVKHGEWGPWLKANYHGSERTARLYMRLAANSGNVADLPTVRAAVALLTKPKAELDFEEFSVLCSKVKAAAAQALEAWRRGSLTARAENMAEEAQEASDAWRAVVSELPR
jgi:hypothetical protein